MKKSMFKLGLMAARRTDLLEEIAIHLSSIAEDSKYMRKQYDDQYGAQYGVKFTEEIIEED